MVSTLFSPNEEYCSNPTLLFDIIMNGVKFIINQKTGLFNLYLYYFKLLNHMLAA